MEIVDSLLLVPLMTGPIFMLAGLVMMYFSPKEINALYGYRTSSSMKNQERWDFAQNYSARELIKFGGILLLTSGLGFVFEFSDEIAVIVGLGLMIAMVVVLFIRVEKAIKKRFPDSKGGF